MPWGRSASGHRFQALHAAVVRVVDNKWRLGRPPCQCEQADDGIRRRPAFVITTLAGVGREKGLGNGQCAGACVNRL